MEKTADAVVVGLDADWSDVGSWSALWEVSPKDEQGNVLSGDAWVHNSKTATSTATRSWWRPSAWRTW